MKKINDNFVIKISIFDIFITVMFTPSINMRKPWFGSIDQSNYEWVTSSTIKFTNNWKQSNPFKLKFALLELPNLIESSKLDSREVYPSYPPGAFIPTYLLSIIFQNVPLQNWLLRKWRIWVWRSVVIVTT